MRIFILEDNDERNVQFRQRYAMHDLTIATNLTEARAKWAPPYDLVSLDHDLGVEIGDPMEPMDPTIETGLQFIHFAAWPIPLPHRVIIHSWNPEGARLMCLALLDIGCKVSIEPFKVGRVK